MKIPISYSFRNLWTRRLTSVLTMGGIGLVVFVFAAVLMLAHGLQVTLVSTGRNDNAVVLRKSAQTEMMSAIRRDAAAVVTGWPEVAETADGRPFVSREMSVVINLRKKESSDMANVTVRGVEGEALALRPQIRMVQGRMFRPGLAEIVVGSSIHARFEGCRIGERIRFGGRWWVITGVFDAQHSGFDSEVWGDVEQMMPAFGRHIFSAMTVRLRDESAFEAFRARLAADPRLQDLESKRELAFYAEQSETMAMFIRVLGLVITVIFSAGAMIGAMITMYAAVAHRTSEIGTLRALGFRRRSILAAFLIEALLLSLIGGVAGVVLASFLRYASVSTVNWGSFSEIAFGFELSPGIVAGSLLFALAMGVAGGVLPAVRAARMNILEALRSS